MTVVLSAWLPTGCSVATYGIGVATMVNDMSQREKESLVKSPSNKAGTTLARLPDPPTTTGDR